MKTARAQDREQDDRPSGRLRETWALTLAALVTVADLLFFGHPLGVSLALFAGVVFAAAAVGERAGRRALAPALLLAAACLPTVEWVQPLSVLLLVAGLATALVWLRLGRRALWAALPRMLADLPLRGVRDLGGAARAPRMQGAGPHALWSGWALPVAGGLLLAVLLLRANPILADLGAGLLGALGEPGLLVRRAAFWTAAALLVHGLLRWRASGGVRWRVGRAPSAAELGLNAASTANALVVFNLALGVQTALDLVYLWSGAALPDGMTYAAYAHRGAYPLLATATLAGAFAVAVRPFVRDHPALRLLLLLWVGQNVALTASALLRLDLYVGAYGLTHLRVRAAIWMALTALGLCLVGWQVLRGRSNGWLAARAAALGLGTLYLCAFVNFAQLIAAHNLAPGRGQAPDLHHLASLGPTAAAALRPVRDELPRAVAPPRIEDWRDWTFRAWRVRRYVDAMPTPSLAPSLAP